ncbi:hypothetical protein [uncultured Desulfosarcina sp.]
MAVIALGEEQFPRPFMPQTVRLPEAVSGPDGGSGCVAGFNPYYG